MCRQPSAGANADTVCPNNIERTNHFAEHTIFYRIELIEFLQMDFTFSHHYYR